MSSMWALILATSASASKHLPGGRLGGRQELHQVPEEADVEVTLRAADREVVQLAGGELLESVVVVIGRTLVGPRKGDVR